MAETVKKVNRGNGKVKAGVLSLLQSLGAASWRGGG